MIWLAPAKLNLFLHILGRRPDGYHNLQTVFQLIDYCDELQFEIQTDPNIEINLQITDNLVIRAARLLQQTYQCPLGAKIQLYKRIPIGGGLGGGSSNAATTLLALNQLWGLNKPMDELAELGEQLGADVPVFIKGRTAWAEGIGEQLTPISLPEIWYVVMVPPCTVSSAEFFSLSELTRNTPAITIQQFLSKQVLTRNDFEIVACKRYPLVASALQWLNQFAEARLTGSGSCVFAMFKDEGEAYAVQQQVAAPYTSFVARGIEYSPVLSWGVAKR